MRIEIVEAMKTALRDKDETRLGTLRLMNAAIKDRDIAARSNGAPDGAGDDEILQLLAKMIKQREESALAYEEGGRIELADREREEIKIIREFMPTPLSDDEAQKAVQAAIEEVGAAGIRDMGKVMGLLKQRHAGQLDVGSIGAKVKAALGAA